MRIVIRCAAQPHGVQCVGKELRLKAVHGAKHSHPLPRMQQILIRQAQKHQFISLHTFSLLICAAPGAFLADRGPVCHNLIVR